MGLSEMDAVIHEYRLPFRSGLGNMAEVDVHPGRLLHLALVRGQICLWAAVDPASTPQRAQFQVAGTGAPLNTAWYHLGSVLEGSHCWHLFSEQRVIRSSGGLREPGPGSRPGPAT